MHRDGHPQAFSCHDEFQPSWEEEGLFARDVNGQLVRVVEASEQDYFQQVTVTIDGQAIRVPRAVPTTDAQGNIVYLDAAGRTQPRRTTIYDAALALCLAQLRRAAGRASSSRPPIVDPATTAALEQQQLVEDAKSKLLRMIPTLCHLDHLAPAGVCRVCSVELAREEVDPQRSRRKRSIAAAASSCRRACSRWKTRCSSTRSRASGGERVRRAVKVLLELLAADHLRHRSATKRRSAQRTGPPRDRV